MEDSRMEELVSDYLEGNLSGELKQHVEKKLSKDLVWKQEYERVSKLYQLIDQAEFFMPPASIRERFEKALTAEVASQSKEEALRRKEVSWYWMAASIVATAMVTVIIVLTLQNNAQRDELSTLQRQVDQNRSLVLNALSNKNSASSRLVGVNTSRQLNEIDSELENALFDTYLNDENSNVRLAALNALAQFAESVTVRSRLVRSLSSQSDPIVMIQLINVLVRLEEQRAVPGLKQILENTENQQVIRDEAEIGIAKLS